jgi:hypothetical protein
MPLQITQGDISTLSMNSTDAVVDVPFVVTTTSLTSPHCAQDIEQGFESQARVLTESMATLLRR